MSKQEKEQVSESTPNYKAVIKKCIGELSALEKVQLTLSLEDFAGLEPLTKEGEYDIGKIMNLVEIQVHNELNKTGDKDYPVFAIKTDKGWYTTGSVSCYEKIANILDAVTEYGVTDYSVVCYQKESKNYKGKFMITAKIVA